MPEHRGVLHDETHSRWSTHSLRVINESTEWLWGICGCWLVGLGDRVGWWYSSVEISGWDHKSPDSNDFPCECELKMNKPRHEVECWYWPAIGVRADPEFISFSYRILLCSGVMRAIGFTISPRVDKLHNWYFQQRRFLHILFWHQYFPYYQHRIEPSKAVHLKQSNRCWKLTIFLWFSHANICCPGFFNCISLTLKPPLGVSNDHTFNPATLPSTASLGLPSGQFMFTLYAIAMLWWSELPPST